MKNRPLSYVLAGIMALGALALCAAAHETEPQVGVAKTAAGAFELKMRILEGIREGAAAPAQPVTSSYLKYQNFLNFDEEQDIVAEQQLKKVYNLKDARLLTETLLVWEKGKSERAFHMFRINGHEYQVIVTPGRVAAPNQYRIEVMEQSGDKKASLLDTEFSLPDKSAAVFGFEDSQLKPYFIFLRGVRWSGDKASVGAVSGVAGKPAVKPPKLVKEVKPIYPEEAKKAGLEGVVIIEATTDANGRVAAAKVLRGVPGLDQAAVDAVKQWVYEPMIIDGVPKPVVFTVSLRFRLDEQNKAKAGGVSGGVEAGTAKAYEKFAEGAVKVEKDIKPPKLVNFVMPVYPAAARQEGVQGEVILSVKTGPDGKVQDVMVLRSVPLLDQAAIDAVKQWVYEPLVIDGKPVTAVFTTTVRFRLE